MGVGSTVSAMNCHPMKASLSRFLNEHLIAASNEKDNLRALGSVPLQDGEKAARLLEELMGEDLAGVMIGTQPHGDHGSLDDPALDPFWAAASDRKAVVFIHPMYGCSDIRLNDYDMINAVGRGLDTTTAVARMLYAGHFTKYPGMSVVLPHGGGALPLMLGRLHHNTVIHPDQYADPVEGFSRIYFDTVVFDPDALNFLIAKAGVEKVMMGSDYPFPIGDHAPKDVVHAAGLSEIDTCAILGGTAARLFGWRRAAMDTTKLENALRRHPRMAMAHLPTRIERMSNMSDEMELELWVKRDDCTGIGFGGNKVRQLEYYFGKAQMIGADTVLITGAIHRTTCAPLRPWRRVWALNVTSNWRNACPTSPTSTGKAATCYSTSSRARLCTATQMVRTKRAPMRRSVRSRPSSKAKGAAHTLFRSRPTIRPSGRSVTSARRWSWWNRSTTSTPSMKLSSLRAAR